MDGNGWSTPHPSTLCLRKWPGTNYKGRLDGSQGQKTLSSTGIRSPDLPSRNESLYLLMYPGLYHVRRYQVFRTAFSVHLHQNQFNLVVISVLAPPSVILYMLKVIAWRRQLYTVGRAQGNGLEIRVWPQRTQSVTWDISLLGFVCFDTWHTKIFRLQQSCQQWISSTPFCRFPLVSCSLGASSPLCCKQLARGWVRQNKTD